MISPVLCAAGRRGAPGCWKEFSSSVSVVCPAAGRKPCLPCMQRDFTGSSEAAETEIIVAGDCAWSGLLQQMCGSAPQPKDIPFVFPALAVVTGLWPAVWPVGCHPWKGALGAWGQIRLIAEQRLHVLRWSLEREGFFI